MKSLPELDELYGEEYFSNRMSNDPKRLKSYADERNWIKKHVKKGVLLDVGCSTGEFVMHLDWDGPCYGMEVSEYAKKYAIEAGVKFERHLFNSQNFFDVIIYRGTIQHIDVPFLYLKRSHNALKTKGLIIFLATPNANSIYYRIWNSLPFLSGPKNYFIPSDSVLVNAMKNLGFTLVDVDYPYLNSPYSSVFKDHFNFLLKLIGFKVKFPFWKNTMNMIFEKD